MHHALAIPEIVEHIIQLAESPDIAACIYVCKLWSEFALDEKWETIDWDCFMDNLFTILFPELRKRINFCRRMLKLPDELSEDSHWRARADWNRFRYYASRIRYLPCDSDDFSEINCEIVAFLARTCPHPHIFPHLYGFTVNVEPDISGSIAYAAKYFCESLRVLGLILPDLSTARFDSSTPSNDDRLNVPTFVQEVVRRSPNISNLTILDGGVFGTDEMESGIVFLLSHLQRLAKVHITSEVLSPRVLVPLALLPHLKYLHVKIEFGLKIFRPIQNLFPPVSNDNILFPALTDLNMRSSLDTTNALLRSLPGSANLRVLKVEPTRQPTEQQRELLSSMISTCSNLVEVSVYDVAFSASNFSPLRRLNQLESLILQYPGILTLEDAELLDLVKSLPRLTTLKLSPPPLYSTDRFGAETSSLTLNSLPLLSHQPSKLRTLHLQLRAGPDVHLNTDIGVHLKELKEFHIDPIGVSDPFSIITDVNDVVNRCLSEECVKSMGTPSGF